MKVKTSELIDEQLDLAVAISQGRNIQLDPMGFNGTVNVGYWIWEDESTGHSRTCYWRIGGGYSPSTDWSQGGPIIDREKIDIENANWVPKVVYAKLLGDEPYGSSRTEGPTPLIAAMRCYVASKLGDEFEIQKGLS